MLGDLAKTPHYCVDAIERAKQVSVPQGVNPRNIVVVGMGGSAISGEILRDWLLDELPISIEVCRDYILPAYVNDKTLVFVNSYSGNTEETLTAFLTAVKRKCTVLAITSGGLLKEFCEALHVPCVIIPSGLQPRVAIPYMFFPLPVLMEKLGILFNISDDLSESAAVIEDVCKENVPEILTKNNQAKQLAVELLESIPVIYGFRQYSSIAHRWKTQFNENSKITSKSDVFPELNHNETEGYEVATSLTKTLSIVIIRDSEESPEIRNRIETTTNLVFDKAKKVLEIKARGKSKLAKMFSVLCMGDFVSVYLAILQNRDPTPVDVIVKVKNELGQNSESKKNLELELSKLK